MNIVCNGEQRTVPEGGTVGKLIADLGLEPDFVVVELNGAILQRDEYDHTHLREGVVLELIRFVGGG